MTIPHDTLWEAEPHTLAKHAVLRGYLEAWFPILGSWSGRLLYVDGFAGPGDIGAGKKVLRLSPLTSLRSIAQSSHQSSFSSS